MPFLGEGETNLEHIECLNKRMALKSTVPCNRSAICKFRCGAAPICIEAGRYENVAEEDRKCPFCKTVIEDEAHVILDCPIYTDFRPDLQRFRGVVDNALHY